MRHRPPFIDMETTVTEKTAFNAFDYKLLSRLQRDCEYYLGCGARSPKHLWAQDEAEQIRKMRELYALLPEKPEWISLADIDRYEAQMVGPANGGVTADEGVAPVRGKPKSASPGV